jgi:hypothetical protein
MYYRAIDAKARINNPYEWTDERGIAEGLMIAAKKMEQAFTGKVEACTFVETKVNNMLIVREDRAEAVNELLEQVEHRRS